MKRLALAALLLAGCTHTTDADVNVASQPTKDTHDQALEQHLSPVGVSASASTISAPKPAALPRRAHRKVSEAARSRGLVSTVTGPLTLSTTCYSWTGNRTASGAWPREGMAAANRFRFGTRLRVEGVGVVTVTDRYGSGTELDIYRNSEQECRRFGRQRLRVEVLR